jgi:hypothetical protein
MKKRKLVEVLWVDAHSSAANVWQDVATFNTETNHVALCQSVGYVWSDTPERIVLVASVHVSEADVSQVSGTIAIPRGMVRKVRVLN